MSKDQIDRLKAAEKAKTDYWQWSEEFDLSESNLGRESQITSTLQPFLPLTVVPTVDRTLFIQKWLSIALILIGTLLLNLMNGFGPSPSLLFVVFASLLFWGKISNDRQWAIPAFILLIGYVFPGSPAFFVYTSVILFLASLNASDIVNR